MSPGLVCSSKIGWLSRPHYNLPLFCHPWSGRRSNTCRSRNLAVDCSRTAKYPWRVWTQTDLNLHSLAREFLFVWFDRARQNLDSRLGPGKVRQNRIARKAMLALSSDRTGRFAFSKKLIRLKFSIWFAKIKTIEIIRWVIRWFSEIYFLSYKKKKNLKRNWNTFYLKIDS